MSSIVLSVDEKQHFIELERTQNSRGNLYVAQLLTDHWISPIKDADNDAEAPVKAPAPLEELNSKKVSIKEPEANETKANKEELAEGLFPTEVSETNLSDAKLRAKTNFTEFTCTLIRRTNDFDEDGKSQYSIDTTFNNYYSQEPVQIKEELIDRANRFYTESTQYFNQGNFEKTIVLLNKAFTLNSFNIQFYLLKIESFIQLCDFKSALITINKLLSILSVWSNNEASYNELKLNLLKKTAFCHFAQGQAFFDSKLYLEALESFNKASELLPAVINYKVRSIVCLHSLGRLQDATMYLNKVINENDAEEFKANLLVLRARILIKSYNLTEAYNDLKRAISIEQNHKEATKLLNQIQDTADQLRNSALSLSIQDRVQEAVNKMTGAITMNPVEPEYNLQRGILYKRMQDFNSAIDDFLLGLDKMNHDEVTKPVLFQNFQRHILLTYNDFAIVCYKKRLYDDAITLLNKAIKLEKNENGFYINRGDCFLKKDEHHFALSDYEQAVEIDPNDQVAKGRVAMMYYNYAIQKYDEKSYQESTQNLDLAIKNSPESCQYYISRARTHYMLENQKLAQLDICICILLDPTNPEIPNIMPRIFENMNLSDVMQCPQMNEARNYLEDLGITSVLDSKNMQNEHDKKKEVKENSCNIFPDINEVVKERNSNLDLIERKKELRKLLKETSGIQLKSGDKATLKPVYNPIAPVKRDPKVFYWKKFSGGIGTKD